MKRAEATTRGHSDETARARPRRRRSTVPTAVTVSAVGSFIIFLIGALYYARSFFLPLVLALLITITFTPLVRHLSRYRIPAGVSAVGLVLLLGLLGFGARHFSVVRFRRSWPMRLLSLIPSATVSPSCASRSRC